MGASSEYRRIQGSGSAATSYGATGTFQVAPMPASYQTMFDASAMLACSEALSGPVST